jgi:hypothetical protein
MSIHLRGQRSQGMPVFSLERRDYPIEREAISPEEAAAEAVESIIAKYSDELDEAIRKLKESV